MGKRKPSFEENLAQLEKIVEELESGQLTLEEALERYERGIAAYKRCSEILAAAEKRLEVLVKDNEGRFHTEPLQTPEGCEEDEP